LDDSTKDNQKIVKGKLKKFSNEVFRNYLIMRLRWRISALERQRTAEVSDLGNRIFRLMKKKKLEIPEVESLFSVIENFETEIEIQEEKLRDIIMKSDVPRQIPEKSATISEDKKPDKLKIDSTPVVVKKENKSRKKKTGTSEKVDKSSKTKINSG